MKRRALLATLFAAVACCFIPSPAWCRSRRNSRGRGRGRWRTPNPLSSLPTARHTGRIVRLGDENPRIKDGIGSSSNTVATLHEQAKEAMARQGQYRGPTIAGSDEIADILVEKWEAAGSNRLQNVNR